MTNSTLGFFARLSLAAKLNLAVAAALVVVLGLAAAGAGGWLWKDNQAVWQDSLDQMDRSALGMVANYAETLEQYAQAVGKQFHAGFSGHLALEGAQRTVSGGRAAPLLQEDGKTLNNDFQAVDALLAQTHAVGTVFVRDGEEFVRISTSLKNEQGARALGTTLAHTHPAYALLLSGQSYTGPARLFGRDYMTHYAPLFDAGGKVIAVAFIGVDFTDGLTLLKDALRNTSIGKSDQIVVIDAGHDGAVALIHPTLEGKPLGDLTDALGNRPVRRMIEQKSGSMWQEVADGQGGFKRQLSVWRTFDKWHWLIVASVDESEIWGKTRHAVLGIAAGSLIIILVLATVIALVLKRLVARPLGQASTIMRALSEGNLKAADALPRRTGADEVGHLFAAIETTCANLRDLLGAIHGNVAALHTEAETLSVAAEQAQRGASGQNAQASEMAAAMQEIASSIEQVSEHANEAKASAEHFESISDDGVAAVRRAVESMNTIATTVRDVSAAVGELGTHSEEISGIVVVIDDIASQINLLALNAAIEAARAGEAGRGFAVVAEEVGKLAKRTGEATKNIAKMIAEVQTSARNAVESIETGLTKVDEGVAQADEAGGRIGEIRRQSGEVEEAVAHIAQAITEQSQAHAEVAQGVEQIAADAESNLTAAQTTAQTADNMQKMAKDLQTLAGRFKG
ncbi:MAG: methyl-accepting chemotaxis protein [Zoogloeaceae bacterium]|jgi:methyl-accepting chemotaxis protein|nr:methyl-accepting chemotaxis protein [Zoogloeaceae bacterium]